MYGMVNKFISTTVINRYGQDAWDKISLSFDENDESFIEMQSYSDDVTFGIVGKSLEVLSVDLSTFLKQMGEDWVHATAAGSYKSMYSLVQGGAFEFLQNLNSMHQVISAQMKDLIPPSFLCQRHDDNSVGIKYFSTRDGLEPFVEGLLKGVCDHFNEPGDIFAVSEKSADQPFSEFKIVFKAQ